MGAVNVGRSGQSSIMGVSQLSRGCSECDTVEGGLVNYHVVALSMVSQCWKGGSVISVMWLLCVWYS